MVELDELGILQVETLEIPLAQEKEQVFREVAPVALVAPEVVEQVAEGRPLY